MIEVIRLAQGDLRNARRFLELPFRIYESIPQWVPPIAGDARRQLDRRRNPYFQHSRAEFLLAIRDGRAVGRMAVLDPENYNRFNGTRDAFFTLFECEPDDAVARALLDAGFDWARSRGLTVIRGPHGFSALDGLGLLVKGFEHRPAFGIPYNPPYYERFLTDAGLAREADILSGYLGGHVVLPDRILRVGERVMERRGLRVERFRKRGELRRLAPKLGDLYNQSLGGTAGNVPLTDREIDAIARQMIAFADPRLIKVLSKGDEPVGFLFAYPDISAAVQRTKGRMWPFGWIEWLREMRTTQWVNVNGAGITEGYRGLGGTALLFTEMYRSVREGGFRHADLVQIGSENFPMLRELREFGVDFYKTHRMFRKDL